MKHGATILSSVLLIITLPGYSQFVDDGGGNASEGTKSGLVDTFHVRIISSQTNMTYDEATKSQVTGLQSSVKGTEFSGTKIMLAANFQKFQADFDIRDTKTEGDGFWLGKKESTYNLGIAAIPDMHWFRIYLGYYDIKNNFDQEAADPPAAYVTDNNSLAFGLGTEGLWNFGGHGINFLFRYQYLSTLERKRNYGYDLQAGLGYSYIHEKFTIGLIAGSRIHRFNNETESKEHPGFLLNVISESVEQFMGLYAHF